MGILYIVSTPIGNLKDISFRAIETLKNADLILCEDTRVTGKLLSHFEISKKMESFNDYNEEVKQEEILGKLTSGVNIALVSDAGTPLISDPGFKLVREAIKQKIRVESIPGASAGNLALTVSGFPTDKFLFVGYPPKKDGKRRDFFEKIKEVRNTMKSTTIVFESPYRLIKTLSGIQDVMGDIEISICRELTKIHEEVRKEKISDSLQHFSEVSPRGEFVLVF